MLSFWSSEPANANGRTQVLKHSDVMFSEILDKIRFQRSLSMLIAVHLRKPECLSALHWRQ